MFTERFTTELKFKCIQFQACNVPEQAETTTTKKWFKDLHHFSRAYMVKIRKWDNVERLNLVQIGRVLILNDYQFPQEKIHCCKQELD